VNQAQPWQPSAMTGAAIGAFGSAVPAQVAQRELWDGFFAQHYRDNPVAKRMFTAVGVDTRHGVVNPMVENVSNWPTSRRMQRFVTEALPLGKEALGLALDRAAVRPEDLGLLIVASCTGYATPGLNILLPRDLGMSPTLRTLLIGHMGCYAAIPGLGAAADYATAQQRPALLLCLELSSLHLQSSELPAYTLTPESVEQMLVHALFADAAAAVVVTPEAGTGGLEVIDITTVTDTATADMMTWDIGELGFRMGLSPEVPAVVGRQVGPAVQSLLRAHGLTMTDVRGWAIHPGGPAILDAVRDALELSAEAMAPSRGVLREYGNCSSPTVLLILDRVRATVSAGDHVVALAFGPGLTLCAALLQMR
jgi:predicted naringenin-chalcone synthase